MNPMTYKINNTTACNIWIHAQRLDALSPFGVGSQAVVKAVSHLGYVQIDTINVVERCHHHILHNRIPNYHPKLLHKAQSQQKTVFEYWTHALSYVATTDFKYFVHKMKNLNTLNGAWFSTVTDEDYKKIKLLLKKQGAITIRDIKDDVLIEKNHPWGSTKPSKKALQLGFYKGDFVISEREGMLKKYDLTERHFNWDKKPKAVKESEYGEYILERGLRSQGIISVDSVCYLDAKMKSVINYLIEHKIKKRELVAVQINSLEKIKFYARADVIDKKNEMSERTHILSPFDPLIIQRKRLKMFFDYEHFFEAYLPKEKRKFGYFALPVLHENKIIAALDLKTDRINKKLLIQKWSWLKKNKSANNKKIIESELDRFEKFQLL